MDTLLYVGQIILGVGVQIAALALSGRLPGRVGERVTPDPAYSEVRGSRCLFGFLLAVASIVFGVLGLAGLSVLPAPVGFVLTGLGLVSVLFATETTPTIYRVTEDGFSVLPAARVDDEILPEPRVPGAAARSRTAHVPGRQVA